MNGISSAALLLSLVAQPGDVFELRGLVRYQGQQHTTSGYFDDVGAMANAAIERSGKDDGIYFTLNPVHPGLLSRAPKNKVRRAGNGDTTSDKDVRVRRSILIDVDPVRPAGISSTDTEHDAAIALANRIADELAAAGWPAPIRADSGNGGHLIYAVDLPVDDGGLVKRVLAALSRRYTTSELKIDEKVFNASRISKIYGTLTRKGENTDERPHRYSAILHAPAKLDVVARETLEAFAPESPGLREVREKTRSSYAGRVAFDLERWIGEHLPDAREKSWNEGRLWLLKECPFNAQHDRSEAYVSQSHAGVIAAGCKHDSCFSTWRELRLRFEPDAYTKSNGNGHRVSDREPPHEVLYKDANYQAELDAFADRDREPAINANAPPATDTAKRPIAWRRAPDLVDEIWSRKDDPWVGLTLGGDELCRVRAGGMVVVIGGSGSGKSSLVSNLLLEHARSIGPAIALSIELPADELAARIAGIRCDASWEDVLRGQIRREFLVDALAMPRLFVLERKSATIENLGPCIDAAKKEYPGQPILVAVDYAQLISSKEREVRLRVTDAFQRIDDVLREQRVVGIAVSQMGRAGAKLARDGERIGVDASDLGAESAAIERFATATFTIGLKGEPRQDGSQNVELSLGKGRMSGGDAVFPMSYWGRSGLWRVAGEAKQAATVREERDVAKENDKNRSIENQLVGTAQRATEPQSRDVLQASVHLGNKTAKSAAIVRLIASGELVEVARKGARSRYWQVWTPDRVNATPGIKLVRDMNTEADDES